MAKPPRRPVIPPDDGGALFVIPRASNGQFAKYKTDTGETPAPRAPPADKKPGPRKRAATPAQLVTRVTRAIERQLVQIEEIIGGARISAAKRTEAEKHTRALALLVRTIGDVTRIRNVSNEAKPDHDDDAVPRDLDEFRRTLERRLAQMVDPPEGVSDRGDEAL